MMSARTIRASSVAEKFRVAVKDVLNKIPTRPMLVGFLCTQDLGCIKYAESTGKAFTANGMIFDLRCPSKSELESQIELANQDPEVHGIMVYYPVFNDFQKDERLRNLVSPQKDVEGLTDFHRRNVYMNIRASARDNNPIILPVTPLAVVKILEDIGVYQDLEVGRQLENKIITIINRSEVVGRPLAAMLANDGALVYSVDIHDIIQYSPPSVTGKGYSEPKIIDLDLHQVLSISDVVISGVPSNSYKISTSSLKDKVVAINFSSSKNFEDNIVEKASILVPSIGAVTNSILQRNLLKIYQSQVEHND